MYGEVANTCGRVDSGGGGVSLDGEVTYTCGRGVRKKKKVRK